MAHRISVRPLSGQGRTLSYTIDASLSRRELEKIGTELSNGITETYAIDRILAPHKFAYAVEVGYLPGVTDNVGATAGQMIEDALGKRVPVYSSYFVFQSHADAGELYNPLVERATVTPRKKFKSTLPPTVPRVKLKERPVADTVDLEVSDEELLALGKSGIKNADGSRRGPLALTLADMHVIRDHFRTLGRAPTDIELESIAQTWSEHCKHTIMNDPLDDIEEGVFKRYIRAATERVRKDKGKKDFCLSVFKDNSGGIAFNDGWMVTHKVETHNSPSALDPFGGAVTGIVGVNRDALGFGLGAKPIANTYGFMVGDPSDTRVFYRDQGRTQPLLSSRRILEGIVRGVNAGGNQSGIPTPLGFVATDPRYRGKPLVFVGTVGLMPRKVNGRKLYEKKARPGDLVVMIGGRVGLDGIHGATFSSEALAAGSPATAVQIGDPITQKKLSDAIIREARDRGLYSSLTDDGAGGLSCSVAEMARESGGCEINLDKVPLKYPGLAPWQTWISESQERMTLSVPRGKWKEFKKLMDKHDVEASSIGTFTKSGRCVVRVGGKKVMDLRLAFLHDGRVPRRQRSRLAAVIEYPDRTPVRRDAATDLCATLASPSVAGHAFISDQYDFEVQGTSVTKPLHGPGRVNADAAMLKPLPASQRGIVISHGYNPWETEKDAYRMAVRSIDMAVRNAIAVGGSLDTLAILDNFCWSSGNSPERLWQLKEAARACYDAAVAYGTPFISGKDSMFNDFKGYDEGGEPVHIAAPPTLLISTLGVVSDVARATTLDFKMPGDFIYLIGTETRTSDVLVRNKKLYKAFGRAIGKGFVASATPVTHGGTEVALAKAAIAGQLGAKVKKGEGAIVVSVAPKNARAFERAMRGSPCTKIGRVTDGKSLTIGSMSIPLSRLTAAYRKPFKGF